MKQFPLLLLFFLALSGKIVGQAQSNFGFEEGVITLKDSSVIKCFVELVPTDLNRVSYKINSTEKVISINVDKIKSVKTAYSYKENITLGKERLMTLTTDGEVKLFVYIKKNDGYNNGLTLIYALKKNGHYTELNAENYNAELVNLLADQSSITEQLKNGKIKFEELGQLIKAYNDQVKSKATVRQITAKVIDSETKKPVNAAKVKIGGTDIVTSTNALGYFQMDIGLFDSLVIYHPEYGLGVFKVPVENKFLIPLTKIPAGGQAMVYIEEQAEFPGGLGELYKYINKNRKYPRDAKMMGIEGKVHVSFVIDTTGYILPESVQVVKSLSKSCDEEAIRLIKASPRWSPGRQNHKAVKCRFELPIMFNLF